MPCSTQDKVNDLTSEICSEVYLLREGVCVVCSLRSNGLVFGLQEC